MRNPTWNQRLLAVAVLAASGAQATTWTATGAALGDTITFVSGGATFTDGVYNTYGDLVLVDRYDSGTPRYSMSFSFDLGGSLAPQIDLVSLRGDFSSLFLTAYSPDGSAVIGRDMGLMGWVPIVAHPDGSYSASWTIGTPFIVWNSFIGLPFTLSFSQAVDEPSPVQLFALAVPLLWAAMKRRASKRGPPALPSAG